MPNPPIGSPIWSADPDGRPWYEITDELWSGFKYFVPAAHLRPYQPEELAPISPEVDPADKWIEVSLSRQWLTAYEGLHRGIWHPYLFRSKPQCCAGSAANQNPVRPALPVFQDAVEAYGADPAGR